MHVGHAHYHARVKIHSHLAAQLHQAPRHGGVHLLRKKHHLADAALDQQIPDLRAVHLFRSHHQQFILEVHMVAFQHLAELLHMVRNAHHQRGGLLHQPLFRPEPADAQPEGAQEREQIGQGLDNNVRGKGNKVLPRHYAQHHKTGVRHDKPPDASAQRHAPVVNAQLVTADIQQQGHRQRRQHQRAQPPRFRSHPHPLPRNEPDNEEDDECEDGNDNFIDPVGSTVCILNQHRERV
ncbi:unknown [Akkermansia sp. CAG:344]|nr:unknown [Akkermansia sp. CAG:344]